MYILKVLDVPEEDNLVKMIKESNVSSGNMKLLNEICWDIIPENHSLRLPFELIVEICQKCPNLYVSQFDENHGVSEKNKKNRILKYNTAAFYKTKSNSTKNLKTCEAKIFMEDNSNCVDKSNISNIKGYLDDIKSSNGDIKYKIIEKDGSKKIVKLAHQYSTVILSINSILLKMNIYQYSVIDSLMKKGDNFINLANVLRIPEKTVKIVLNSLVKSSIVLNTDKIYYLNSNYGVGLDDIKQGVNYNIDISEMDINEEEFLEICVDSHLQSICMRILKRAGKMPVENLILEIKALSKVNTSDERIINCINKIVEKGLGETRGDIIEYIQ